MGALTTLTTEDLTGGISGTTDLDATGAITVKTSGAQSYNKVLLTTDNTLLTGAGSTITFNGTVNGGFALTTETGTVTFDGIVGGATALTSLTTKDAAGGFTGIT